MIVLDPSDAELMEFWRARNPEALAVVDVMELKPGDPATAFICQVRAGARAGRQAGARVCLLLSRVLDGCTWVGAAGAGAGRCLQVALLFRSRRVHVQQATGSR